MEIRGELTLQGRRKRASKTSVTVFYFNFGKHRHNEQQHMIVLRRNPTRDLTCSSHQDDSQTFHWTKGRLVSGDAETSEDVSKSKQQSELQSDALPLRARETCVLQQDPNKHSTTAKSHHSSSSTPHHLVLHQERASRFEFSLVRQSRHRQRYPS